MDTHAAGRAALMQGMIERSREIARARRLADDLRHAAMQRIGLDAATNAPVALVVPALRRPLVAVTDRRRARLRRYLSALLRSTAAEALAGRTGAADDADHAPAAEPSAVVRAACASCQGRCCGYGAERAYLTEATMARVAAAGDQPTPGRILRRYMARVPHEAVKDSCIFHGAQGCTLDRSLRSDVCNRHYCAAMKGWLRNAAEHAEQDVLVMAVQDDTLQEARLVAAETPR